MRWSNTPAELPLQPMTALRVRAPGLDATRSGGQGLLVVVCEAVRDDVMSRVRGSGDEQGGLLVGEVFAEDPVACSTSRVVLLRQAVPALDFSSSGISLRMESGVWERARVARGPLDLVVGWYHSHPGLGAFFSATDRRTQAAFFPHPYSVGWVVDPVRGEEAYFVGRDAAVPGGLMRLTDGDACGGGAAPT